MLLLTYTTYSFFTVSDIWENYLHYGLYISVFLMSFCAAIFFTRNLTTDLRLYNIKISDCLVTFVGVIIRWPVITVRIQWSRIHIKRTADCRERQCGFEHYVYVYIYIYTPRTHTKRYAAALPQLTFKILKTFKFSDFNREPTSSLKMIWIMIETCWSVFKCFNTDIID
jgi:hypothetical protein